MEREAADVGISIKGYHSDNGVFNCKDFKEHCRALGQKLRFSGVGAHHQNGVAERAIQTITSMARACLIHCTLRWPERAVIDLWPQAMSYAIWVYNRLPSDGRGWTPEELWSRSKTHRSDLSRAHVFGCPVYVLDPRLQDGKKIPKWDSRARQGIFVGFSPDHSSLVPLVLNPRTQHISPQYHVIFDDAFSTAPSLCPVAERDARFEQLFDTAEFFIEHDDATRANLELSPEWLTSSEREAIAAREQAAAQLPLPMSVTPPVPEGALSPDGPPSRSVTPPQAPPLAPPLAPSASSLHTLTPSSSTESSPSMVSAPSSASSSSVPVADEDDSSVESLPRLRPRRADWKSGPWYDRDHKFAKGDWTTTALACLLALPEYALASVSSWSSPPPLVANVGSRTGARSVFNQARVRRRQLNELALLQDDWSELGLMVCNGYHPAFSPYFDPDLTDDVDAFTLQAVQPHVLQAKAKTSDADAPSYKQAMNSPDADKWYEAMETEFKTLEDDQKAWSLVKREPWMKVVPSTWAFRLKRYPDGLVKKFKARFCVRGDMQVEGIDYFETWAPVVQWTTVRTMMILATKLGLQTAQADITAAFVHAPLPPGEQVFVHQPAGFHRGKDLVLQLHYSLYGMRQSPRNFYRYFKDKLQAQGLLASDLDPCLFIGDKVIAVLYVDDVLLYARDDADIDSLLEALRASGIAIRREGSAEGFLGVTVERTETASGSSITLTQAGLTKRIIEALGLCSHFSTSISTPAEAAPLPKDANGAPAAESFNYAAVVGMLLYLSGHSRPDIAFAVHQCARYTFCPKRKHELALIRIGRYLKGTMDKGLIMSPSDMPSVDCYPDADFAGLYGYEDVQDPHCARSRTGYVILAFSCPVLWVSRMQTELALSTMEAEYVAMSSACKDLFPVVDVIRALSVAVGLGDDFDTKFHIKVHEDNVGALTLGRLEPGRMTPRSKHYAIKYHWFRERVSDPSNRITLHKVESRYQLGDIFTKGLTKENFERLRRLLMGW